MSQQEQQVQQEKESHDVEMLSRKLQAEKLELEIAELKTQRRPHWAVKSALPTLIGAIAVAFSSWLFSDSLLEESRAQIRRDVLTRYFAVDNQVSGKRKQMLNFVEQVLAEDDPRLGGWLEHERRVVAKARAEESDKVKQIREDVARLEEESRRVDAVLLADQKRSSELISSLALTPSRDPGSRRKQKALRKSLQELKDEIGEMKGEIEGREGVLTEAASILSLLRSRDPTLRDKQEALREEIQEKEDEIQHMEELGEEEGGEEEGDEG